MLGSDGGGPQEGKTFGGIISFVRTCVIGRCQALLVQGKVNGKVDGVPPGVFCQVSTAPNYRSDCDDLYERPGIS